MKMTDDYDDNDDNDDGDDDDDDDDECPFFQGKMTAPLRVDFVIFPRQKTMILIGHWGREQQAPMGLVRVLITQREE